MARNVSENISHSTVKITDDERVLLSTLHQLFERFDHVVQQILNMPVEPPHPLRRTTDHPIQLVPREPSSTPHTARTDARVAYQPLVRTYRGKHVAPRLSTLKPTTRAVYDAIVLKPGQYVDFYVQATNLSKPTVRSAIFLLRTRRLIESIRPSTN